MSQPDLYDILNISDTETDLSSEQDQTKNISTVPSTETSADATEAEVDNNNTLNEERCTVCLEALKANLIITPCGHRYHYDCLKNAYQAVNYCPNCRQECPTMWLLRHQIVMKMTSTEYWAFVEEHLLEPPPEIGPMLPIHQRRYDVEQGTADSVPAWWTRPWIEDRIIEMRVRFNIPENIMLTTADVKLCEYNGVRGIQPEWTGPTWYYHDSD